MKATSETIFEPAEFYRSELQKLGRDGFVEKYNHPVFVLSNTGEEPSSGSFHARTNINVKAAAKQSGLEALVVPVCKRKGAVEFPIISIGRNPKADIVFRDRRISKFHAYVTFQEGNAFLEDRNSTNGTFVDGKFVGSTPYALADGSTVVFGSEDGIRGMYFTAERFVEYLNVYSGAIPDF